MFGEQSILQKEYVNNNKQNVQHQVMLINLNSESINQMNVFCKVLAAQQIINIIIKIFVLLHVKLKMINYMLNQMANLVLYLVMEMFGNMIHQM